MNGRFFGACFSVFRYKNGAVAPVDYSSTFATAHCFYYRAEVTITNMRKKLKFVLKKYKMEYTIDIKRR